MTITLKLTFDRSKLGPIGDKKLERAIVRALKKAGGDAARSLKAASSRKIRARKRIRVSKVNASLPLIFPKSPKGVGDLVWRMKVDTRAVPLAEFPYRQTKRGVSVAVNKNGRKLIESAFVATMKSGHTGIFKRAEGAGKRVGRLPIKELYTTKVSDVFNDDGMVPEVQGAAQKTFASAFARIMKLELKAG